MAARINDHTNANPVRILLVSPDYEGYSGLGGVKKNVAMMEGVYARLQKRKGADFRNRYIIDDFFKRSNNFEDLRADILSGDYDIIHISLHSEEGTIFFSDSEQIPHSKFRSLFSVPTDIKAVILNVCKSDDIVMSIRCNVERVLGWSHEVIYNDAVKVSEIFYSSLFKGRSIEESFKAVAAEKSIKPLICSISTPDDDIVQKKRLSIILISIGLMILLLIVPVNKILNPGTTILTTSDTDSLQILFPPSGSIVERNDTLRIDAKLRAEGIPWIYILPPGGTQWWPQNGGSLKDDHWEFPVSFGNEIDSGRFWVLAMIIKNNIAAEMQEWYDSQSTSIKSDPLSDELVRSFYWYEADTAIYYRIRK